MKTILLAIAITLAGTAAAFGLIYRNADTVDKSEPSSLEAIERELTCHMAVVEWRDAVMYVRRQGDFDETKIDELPAHSITIGCVIETERTIAVLQTFSEGRPIDYMIIPKEWATKIRPLDVRAEPEAKSQP